MHGFQEREERAVYCDAHVLEINRQLHDINSCRCTFVVRYDHDDIEVIRVCVCLPARVTDVIEFHVIPLLLSCSWRRYETDV